MDLSSFFEELLKLSEYEADQKIVEKSKELGTSKRLLQNDYKGYKNAKESKQKAERHLKSVESFNRLFGIQGVNMPNGYYLDNGYLAFEDSKICKIFTFLRKIQTHKTQYLEFASLTDNRIIDIRDLLKNDRLAVEFGTSGEYLDSKRVQQLSQFIAGFLIENETKIQIIRGAERAGWNEEGGFDLPNRDGCFFIDEELKKRFSKKGSLAGEIELMNETAKGKVFLLSLFGLSSVFYGLVDIPLNFICHVGGQTGEGKSLSIKTAMALFCEKDIAKCGKNFNATLNGQEAYLEKCHSVPAWLDETEVAKSVDDVITVDYVFSEGTGRSRAFAKDGEVLERAIKSFKGVLFQSGEKSLSDMIKTAGEKKNKPMGIVRRSLDLSSISLWEGVDRKKVGMLIDKNHGNFIDVWLEKIISIGKENIEDQFNSIMERQNISLDGKEYLFALLELTLEILSGMNIISSDAILKQREFIRKEILISLALMNEVKNDYLNFLEDLTNMVAYNRTKIKGMVDDEIVDRNGIIGELKDNYLYLTTAFIKEVCSAKGYVWNQVSTKLYDRAILLKHRTKDGREEANKKVAFTSMRCFIFDTKKIESEFNRLDGKVDVHLREDNGYEKKIGELPIMSEEDIKMAEEVF